MQTAGGFTPKFRKLRWPQPKSQQSRQRLTVKKIMKYFILLAASFLMSVTAQAQLKKDGTPDMRYRENRQMYGSSYTSPSYSATPPSVEYQSSYERNGTHVDGSYHTKSNGTNLDNWSTTGNTNPVTGSRGTKAQDYSSDAHNYGQGHTIQTGPRGGQYYENSHGSRVYVPKRSF